MRRPVPLQIIDMAVLDAANNFSTFELKLVSFNMHGFNQGWLAVTSLINDIDVDIILLQEHWLTPSNLNKFDELFHD